MVGSRRLSKQYASKLPLLGLKFDYQLLDFLAFEFSWFVCYRFDCPGEISVGDWFLIETVCLATKMQCIRMFLKENGVAPADITEMPVDAVMACRQADAVQDFGAGEFRCFNLRGQFWQ